MQDKTEHTKRRRFEYASEAAIARQLSMLAAEIMTTPIPEELASRLADKDYIFFVLTEKALATFEAIQLLCEKSFVDDAFALL